MSSLYSLFCAVARHLPVARRAFKAIDELQSRNHELEAKLADALAWLKRTEHLWQWEQRGPLTYDADGLATWNHVTDFLDDPKFMKAYNDAVDSWRRQAPAEAKASELHFEWRVAIACWAGWHAKHLPGDFVECGVNTGLVSQAVCSYTDFNSTGKKFFLFDTYEGIPLDQAQDDEKSGVQLMNSLYYRDHYQSALENFRNVPTAVLVKGAVPGSLHGVEIDRVCYLHIDMNIAYPEVEALKYFWPKMTPGGVILFDDFGFHPIQNNALDELAESLGVKIALLPTGQGLLIKP